MKEISEQELLRRFWRKVVKADNGCWLWTGGHTKGGYGRFWDGTRKVLPNRFLYERVIGPIPEGLLLCHTCDHPPCVNPEHQFPGTVQDNMDDYRAKGGICGYPKGKLRGFGASAMAASEAIKHSYTGKWGDITQLAHKYNLCWKTVERIVNTCR